MDENDDVVQLIVTKPQSAWTKPLKPEFILGGLAVFLFLFCGFFTVVIDRPMIIAKSNFTFRYIFVSVGEIVSEYNAQTPLDRAEEILHGGTFSHIVRVLEKDGAITTSTKTE